jgi:hypothetical protein
LTGGLDGLIWTPAEASTEEAAAVGLFTLFMLAIRLDNQGNQFRNDLDMLDLKRPPFSASTSSRLLLDKE